MASASTRPVLIKERVDPETRSKVKVMGLPRILLSLLLLLVGQKRVEARSPLSARIGGVFNSIDSTLGSSLARAVEEINNSSSLLPSTRLDQLTAYRSEYI